jgi:hypothetical protein
MSDWQQDIGAITLFVEEPDEKGVELLNGPEDRP